MEGVRNCQFWDNIEFGHPLILQYCFQIDQVYDKLDCNSKTYLSFTHYLLIKGCENPGWHADGSCDDVNNNEACFFDGGDCCGYNVNTQYCSECQCLEWGGRLR